MSDVSHRFIGWQLAELREAIPYDVALLEVRRPTEEEIEWGRSLEPLAQEYPTARAHSSQYDGLHG